jgi:Flp pilus assembly protein TadD
MLGHHGDAVASYDRALRINPGLSDATYHKGFALAKLGRTEDAVQEYEHLLKFFSDAPRDTVNYIKERIGALKR